MSLRILVIDDEPALIGAVAALVGSVGHRVSAAYDGHEALRRFDADQPDLVILDLAMPGLDGIAVCREVRARGATPIIVLSGEGQEAAKVEALDAGADDYVTKPFGKDELLARIRAVTRRRTERPEPGSCRSRRSSSPCSRLCCGRVATSCPTRSCSRRAGAVSRIPTHSGSSRTSPGCARSCVRPGPPCRPPSVRSATASPCHRQR